MMDPRERRTSHEEVLRTAMEGNQAEIWTSMPGIIRSFDAKAMTAVVQPVIQGIQTDPNLVESLVNLPEIPDVPVEFPSGGGHTLTFPIAPGDECMLDFSSRCIDAWWQLGGVQRPLDRRMHDLSDAVARVGVRSQPRVLKNVSTTTTQLRSDDGSHFVEIDGQGKKVRVVAGSNVLTLDGQGGASTWDLAGGSLTIKNASTVSINP